MKILRALSISTIFPAVFLTIFLAGLLMLPASAMAQTQLLPPPGAPKPLLPPPGMPAPVKKEKPKPKPPVAAKKPATPTATPVPTATVTPAPVFDDPNVDLVFGAYQRGQYKTAFDLATNRAQFNGDPKAMTMLGELYANGLGVKRDYAKAA